MQQEPLLNDEKYDSNHKIIKCKKFFQCTCATCMKLIELLIMCTQIAAVILDWPSSCNRDLHIWMIISLLYRLTSFLFQWICIEPCLQYLRKDRSDKISKDDESGCCINLLFCWVLPWLWIIDNDIFLLIWSIIGTLLLFNDTHIVFTSPNTCNLLHINHNLYSYIFYYTMLTILAISYIFWIITLLISFSLFCCPQLINACFLKMGYAISRPKGEQRINSIKSIDISDMPGINNTLSYSITAPSRMNKTNVPRSTQQHSQQYIPPNKTLTKSNEPLPNNVYKQFKRRVFIKKETSNNTNNISPDTIITITDEQNRTISPPPDLDTINNKNIQNKQRESKDLNKITFETESKQQRFIHKQTEHSVISTTTVSGDELSSNNKNINDSGIEYRGNSFSSMRYWLSAKRSTMFSNEFISNLEPIHDNQSEKYNKFKSKSLQSNNNNNFAINIFDNVVGLNNLPSPNILRRISKSQQIECNDNMKPLDLNDTIDIYHNNNINNRNQSVFAPPLTQKMLDMNMKKPLLFGRNNKKHSIINDVNLIVDTGDLYCSLCQDVYNENEILIILSCNHQFHEVCSKQWFKHKSVCPICRKKMCFI